MWKDRVKDVAERGSKYLAQKLNPALTRAAVDAGALAGIVHGADQLPDLSSPTVATLGAGTALGLYGLDKLVTQLVRDRAEQRPMTSRLHTAALAGILAVSGYSLYDHAADIYRDIGSIFSTANWSSPTDIDDARAKEEAQKLPVSRKYVLPDFSSVTLAKKGTKIGDVQRTYRWKPVIEAVEKKYRIPRGVLAGLVMQESYGDPLQPNATDDGGIGLIHTQGTTAKILGLEIYGDSHNNHDLKHGKQLNRMFDDCGYVVECVAEQDGRAHPLKNLDAIARYMLQGYRAHGSWDAAIQWVRGPGLVNKSTGRRYLSKVKDKREAFNTLIAQAENDFNKLNSKVTWDKYQGAYHQMCEKNFGLEQYH